MSGLLSVPFNLDPEAIRRARIKRPATDDTPDAQPVAGSLSRVSPVVDVEPGQDGVFSRAASQPTPNTISTAGRAAYESPIATPAPQPARVESNPMRAGFVDQTLSPIAQSSATSRVAAPGIAGGNLYDEIATGPASRELQRVQQAGPQPAHGWGRVGRVLLNLGLGNPVGAAVEGIAPGYAARQRYQQHDLPLAQRNAGIEQGMQAQRVGDISRIAAETGVLPGGQATEPARHRMAVEQETASRNRVMDENRDLDRQQRMDIARQAEAAKRRRDLVAMDKAGILTPGQRAELAKAAGVPGELREPFLRGDISIETDGEGNFVGISKRALQEGRPAVTTTGVGSLAGVKADRQQAHQKFMEGIASGHLAISRQNADTYRRVVATRGEGSPEAEAFRQLQEDGKIDENGMADNPKWQAAYDSAYQTAKSVLGYDDAAAQATAERQANKQVKEGRKVAVTSLPEFKGLKASIKAGKGTGQSAAKQHPMVGKIMTAPDGRKIRVRKVEGDQVTDYEVVK